MRNVVESRWLSGKKLIIISLIGLIMLLALSPASETNPYQELYDELLRPTVKISTPTGTGSGVVISHRRDAEGAENTYILSAAHVVGSQAEVSVYFYDYEISVVTIESAHVVLTDTVKDLALLEVNKTYSYKVKLAPKGYQPRIFTPVWTVGCSLGLPPRPSSGIITAIPLSDLCASAVEVSSPILPGNSGGPVYDANTHELIGIAVWVRTYHGQLITTMAGIVPVQQIYEFIDEYPLRGLPIIGCPRSEAERGERTKELKNKKTNSFSVY